MGPASYVDAQMVANARLERGMAAWDALNESGGIWPPCDTSPPPWGIWDGMGEYDAGAVQEAIQVALPTVPIERAWPWVARAIFIYETERKLRDSYAPPEPNSDALVDLMQRQSVALRKSLLNLNFLSIRPPEEVGRQHFEKATQVHRSLRTRFGGPNTLGAEYVQFLAGLEIVSEVCAGFNSKAATDRRRGALDPHLSTLVWELSDFWTKASGRAPSASNPGHADNDAPFVRLVNGCLRLAGAAAASPRKVGTAISNPPTYASQKN